MKRRYLMFSAAILAFFAAVWYLDPLLLIIFGVAPLIWIGIPASLISGILLLVATRTGQSRRPALTALAVIAVFACFVGLAIPVNHFIQERAVAAAKDYPARVAQLLESYRESHGSYPTSLDQLSGKPPVPRLLRRSYGYRSAGCTYYFSFPQPGGMIDTWNYDSATKKWHLST